KSFLALLDVVAKAPDKEKEVQATRSYWTAQIEKYEGPATTKDTLLQIKTEAERLKAEGEALRHKSEAVHAAVNYLDYGHLAIEMALVLCSVALLTKMRSYWFAGILLALLGV